MQSCDCCSLLWLVLVISRGIFLTDPWVGLCLTSHLSTIFYVQHGEWNEMKWVNSTAARLCKMQKVLQCIKQSAFLLLLQLLQLCLLCCCSTICFDCCFWLLFDCCFLHLVTLFAVLWRIFRQQLLFWRCASMRKCMLLHLLSCLCRLWSASCSSCSSCFL